MCHVVRVVLLPLVAALPWHVVAGQEPVLWEEQSCSIGDFNTVDCGPVLWLQYFSPLHTEIVAMELYLGDLACSQAD